MPNIKKELQKCKHPNSRKTLSLTKKMKKMEKRDQTRLGHHIKQNLLGEKIIWFKERLPDEPTLGIEQIAELIQTYLARHDEELEQIELKNSIGHRKNRQHASRKDIITITKSREKEEFESCGLELPDFMNPQQMELLRDWNGELRFIQNFKLRRFSKNDLCSEHE